LKKSFSFFLAFVFLFNTAGVLTLFSHLKQEHYESVFKMSALQPKFVRLIIPKTEKIFWEKKNEIIYRGKYYDVFRKTEDAENNILTCFEDSKDKSLAVALSKIIGEQQSEKSGGKGSSNTKTFFNDYLFRIYSWLILPPVSKNNQQYLVVSPAEGFHSFFSPPPEIL
jgi:hypothetical protein